MQVIEFALDPVLPAHEEVINPDWPGRQPVCKPASRQYRNPPILVPISQVIGNQDSGDNGQLIGLKKHDERQV